MFKTIISIVKKMLPKWKPQILKMLQNIFDSRQPEDINQLIKVLDKYKLGLDGETQEHLLNDIHDAMEKIILNRIDNL